VIETGATPPESHETTLTLKTEKWDGRAGDQRLGSSRKSRGRLWKMI
jgi:hypothetical protein